MNAKLLVPSALFAAAVLVAAGCGGGSSKKTFESKQEYAAALDSICGPARRKIDDLEPPDEVRRPAEDFVSTSREELRKIDDLVDAARTGDAAKLQEIQQELGSLDSQTDRDAREIGATACMSSR